MAVWQATEGLTLWEVDSREAVLAYVARNPGLSFVAREVMFGGSGASLVRWRHCWVRTDRGTLVPLLVHVRCRQEAASCRSAATSAIVS